MIADILHDFYTMPCTLLIGGVPTNVTLRWYKAPAGAKFLPFPSTIFSHVWDNTDEADQDTVGEVGFPRTWDPGRNPGYQGQCYRGDPSWFQTGVLPALPIKPVGPPCVCFVPPEAATGGVLLGGSATVSSTVCQLPGPPVSVDFLDGAGVHKLPFTRVFGGSVLFLINDGPYISPTFGVQVFGSPVRWFGCVRPGTYGFVSQPPPGHFAFFPVGALNYLVTPYQAEWNYIGGTPFVVYTTPQRPPGPPTPTSWLRADAGTYQDQALTNPATLDGQTVDGWKDQEGFANATCPAGPILKLNQLNGLPILRFNGSSQFLYWHGVAPLLAGTAPYTFYFVAANLAVNGQNVLLWAQPDGPTLTQYSYFSARATALGATGQIGERSPSPPYAYETLDAGAGAVRYSMSYDGANLTVRTNADAGATVPVGANPAGVNDAALMAWIHDRTSGPVVFTAGDLGEVLAYNRVLSPTEDAAAWAWLNRWL